MSPDVVAGLILLVASVVPAIPDELHRALVILGYDVTPFTPAFACDTVTLLIPRPEEWLGVQPYTFPGGTERVYDLTTADAMRIRIENVLQEELGKPVHRPTIQGDNGKRYQYRWEYGTRQGRGRKATIGRPGVQGGRAEPQVWAEPFGRKARHWLKIQVSPMDAAHQLFLARLRGLIGADAWGQARIYRVDLKCDLVGARLQDFVPLYEGRKLRNDYRPGSSRRRRRGRVKGASVGLGSRRVGGVFLRVYEFGPPAEGDDAGWRLRVETEWKPRASSRPRLRDLAATPFPYTGAIGVLPARYLGTDAADRDALQRLLEVGLPELSPDDDARVDALRERAAGDGVSFSFTDGVRDHWTALLQDLRAWLEGRR